MRRDGGFMVAAVTAAITSAVVTLVMHLLVLPRMPDGSGGPRRVVVPAIRGLSTTAATRVLDSIGLSLLISARSWGARPEGTVLSQRPSAGGSLPKGGSVHVVVSAGRLAGARVPEVTGLSEKAARDRLRKAGFTSVARLYRRFSGRVPGTVMTTMPAPESTTRPGQPITLVVVSPGPGRTARPPRRTAPTPRKILVPRVLRLRLSAARARLRKAGLTVGRVRYDDDQDVAPAVVLRQRPRPGGTVKPGTRVDLVVNEGKPEVDR